jgi:predicted phosphohydrolase
MRVHILSDLHLEFAPFTPADVNADIVVLAGDTHTGRNGIKWCLNAFPRRPVIYVLGNHEFYGQKIPKLVLELKEMARGSNVHVLENDCVHFDDTVFVGATLWTDFRLNGDVVLAEAAAQIGMTDFRRIRVTPPRFDASDRLTLVSFMRNRWSGWVG